MGCTVHFMLTFNN